jgi:predicted metal-binding membrane protein
MNVARKVQAPTQAGVATVILAAIAWVVLVFHPAQLGGMAAMSTLSAFVATWVVMMTAMMLPAAVPFVSGFVRDRRADWPVAAALVVVAYLAVWTAFGGLAYFAYGLLPPAWMGERVIAGAALVAAGLYAFTPVQRSCQARCQAMCREPGPAVVRGLQYGVNCVGCSGALMVALLFLGLSSLIWMVVVSAVVLVYKLAPLRPLWQNIAAVALVAIGMGLALLPTV